LDTADAQFSAEVTKLVQSIVARGDPVYGASCVGVGKGSTKWSEEELKALEIGVVGAFARGCLGGGITRFSLLSAVGSTPKSRIRYVRVMGLKEETVSTDWLPTPRDFSSGNYRGQCSHAALCGLVGASDSGTFWRH
jgi:hypothetical protein